MHFDPIKTENKGADALPSGLVPAQLSIFLEGTRKALISHLLFYNYYLTVILHSERQSSVMVPTKAKTDVVFLSHTTRFKSICF